MQFSGLRSWERVPAWIPFSNSLQWLFSASATLYILDYPFCCNWWNFILCNSWVIILLKICKPAFLLIKYLCSIRAWVPMSFFLSLPASLQLSLSLSYCWLWTTRFQSTKGPQQVAPEQGLWYTWHFGQSDSRGLLRLGPIEVGKYLRHGSSGWKAPSFPYFTSLCLKLRDFRFCANE